MAETSSSNSVQAKQIREVIISQSRLDSPAELKLRQLIKDEMSLGSGVSSSLLRISEWTTSVQSGELAATLGTAPAGTTPSPAAELIENIAENLVQDANGLER